MCIWHIKLSLILRAVLHCSCGRLVLLPFVFEQIVKLPIVPGNGVLGPRSFEAGGDCVFAFPRALRVDPPESLQVYGCTLGVDPHVRVTGCPVRLAEGVPTGDQCNGLLVVHAHPAESYSDVVRRCSWVVQYAARALRVHLNETHLDCTQFLFERFPRFFGIFV